MSWGIAETWTASVSVLGALVWVILVSLAGGQRAPLGMIELLFLFAPLVIVPLGLELARTIAPAAIPQLDTGVRMLQPFASVAAAVSFWLPPGRGAGALALPWVLLCGLVALTGLAAFIRDRSQSLLSLVANIARIDLAIGGSWLLVSRAGLRPIGLQEPIILLTAVHFHYTGFATALIGAATLRVAERHDGAPRMLRWTVMLIVLLPFVVAAGFVFSQWLRATAAVALSLTVVVFSALLFREAAMLESRTARTYLRIACLPVLFGMGLAATYAVGNYLGKDSLWIPRMASTHGVMNGLGFVLPALLGWLIELHVPVQREVTNEGGDYRRNRIRGASLGAGTGRTRPRSRIDCPGNGSTRPECPEFAAREFYET